MKNLNLKLVIGSIIISVLLVVATLIVHKTSDVKIDEINQEVTKYNNLIMTIQNKEEIKQDQVKDYEKYLDIYPIGEMAEERLNTVLTAIELENNIKLSEKTFSVSEDYVLVSTYYEFYYKDLEKYYGVIDDVLASGLLVDNSDIELISFVVEEHGKRNKYYGLQVDYRFYYFNDGSTVE